MKENSTRSKISPVFPTITMLTILALSACLDDTKRRQIDIESFTIELEESFENKQKVLLSSIASSVNYVMFDESEQAILDDIYLPQFQIKLLDDYLFATDDKKLLRFDLDGNLLNSYGAQGRGPGEFINVKDFSVCYKEEVVMILCSGTMRMLKYTLDGTYIDEFKIEFAPFYFSLYNDKIIFINTKGLRQLSDFYTITITDWNGEILDRLIYREDEYIVSKKEQIPVMSGCNLYFSDSLIFYWEFLYDSIWVFNQEFQLKEKGVLNIGKNRINPVITEDKRKLSRDNSLRRISYYIEAGDYMFLETLDKGMPNRIMYDIKNKSGKSLYAETGNDQRLQISFVNDIDGLIPFWPQGQGNGNRLYRLFYAHEIENHLKNTKSDVSGNTFANEIIGRINSDNNYRHSLGLMIVTLK